MTVQGNILGFPILSLITFLPTVGAILLLFVGRDQIRTIRNLALVSSLASFVVSLLIPAYYDASTAGVQFTERASWIPSLGVTYFFGLDGISLWLVMLTTFLSPIAVLCSYEAIKHRAKEYYIFLLILETGMLGVFVALDFFLFYVFWEVMLVPMYFLIGVWGSDRRLYSAIKFFLYTLFGSVVMLLGILAVYFYAAGQTGRHTFDVLELMRVAYPNTPLFTVLGVPFSFQDLVWLAFALSFAIKVPMFPFHTWLPDAHTDAPTAGSVILAGVLLKMGTYGFVRFNLPLFPEASQHFVPLVFVLSIIAIIYGAMVCMVQPDMKRLIAYSSVSHMGFVMLGMFAFNQQGVQGSILQMINHGLSTGGLFLVVGLIYDRRHTRLISELGGLSRQMPVYATLFAIIMLSSMGLPGLNGFIGEFLILIGAFQVRWWWGAFAVTGIILGAAYMLWLYQRTMFGEITKEENKTLPDLSVREMSTLIPIIAFCFFIGLYPAPFLKAMEVSVANVIETVVKGAGGKAVGAKATTVRPGTPREGQVVGQPGTSQAPIARLSDPQVVEPRGSRLAAQRPEAGQ
ncbi:MAG TPA: NADH-quinone oxidoreductase subunit M [Candidatus Methylomirabilis sp.]|nr:NADH-quinone oxidoreductase subunit M [Candidatus Methylomirabilis sp.]HSC70086.1 NADH-quinone oxidoreductase subunit M [Candidatus Methylomirabilis sp.]